MRLFLSPATALLLLATPALAQDVGGISSPLLSSCIAGVSLDPQSADTTYGAVALDGRPGLKIRDDDRKEGSLTFTIQASGTGTWWQGDGAMVPFRFTCQLERPGQTVKLRTRIVTPSTGDVLAPHRLVVGTATFARDIAPGAAELRLQLVDLSVAERPDIVAEQVVRSVRAGPMLFALRLPAGTPLAGRKLAITAIVVQQGQVRLRLAAPKPVGEADLRAPISLVLE